MLKRFQLQINLLDVLIWFYTRCSLIFPSRLLPKMSASNSKEILFVEINTCVFNSYTAISNLIDDRSKILSK